jgi:membrane-associated phospholipid phosphatase
MPPTPARAEHWPHAGWWLAAVGCVLVAGALLIDQRATDWLTREQVRLWIIRVFGVPASAAVFLVPLAILATYPNARRLCIGFLAPLLLSTVVTHVLKWLVGRARPHMHLGPLHFEPIGWIGDWRDFVWGGSFESFPSGHSSAAATLAVLLGIYVPKARWLFYSLAALVGLERIINDKHFLSDVLAGFLVGVLSVYVCVRWLGPAYYRKEWPPGRAPDLGGPAGLD